MLSKVVLDHLGYLILRVLEKRAPPVVLLPMWRCVHIATERTHFVGLEIAKAPVRAIPEVVRDVPVLHPRLWRLS